MIIIQDLNKQLLSIHTTVPAFTRYYEIDSPNIEKYIREKLVAQRNPEGINTITYKFWIITKIKPL